MVLFSNVSTLGWGSFTLNENSKPTNDGGAVAVASLYISPIIGIFSISLTS